MTATDQHQLLREHREVFDALESRISHAVMRGADDDAAGLCQLAGEYAWQNHAGVFTSPLVEETLETIGQRSGEARRAGLGTQVHRVLHVMTDAYQLGGHTRLVQRWVELDANRSHSLALTAARATAPRSLWEAAWGAHGEVYRLGAVHRSLIGRAGALRELAATFDAVVVHAHPHDVVPSLAFAGNAPVPVALLNHADHVFWIGVRAADRVLNLRASGADLNVRRRGIPPNTNSIVPIPLAGVERRMDRHEAKRRLGLAADDVLVLTMAGARKYLPIDGTGFLDVVAPALLEHERCVVVAIGPRPQGRWSELESATQGRLRAVGSLADPALYLDAADLYVDSFPFSSLTSLLEAGARGNPLLAYMPSRPGADVMGPEDLAYEDSLLRATSPTELARLCSQLAASPDRRVELGEAQQRTIEAFHTGPGWRHHVEAAYQELLADPDPRATAARPSVGPDDTGLLDAMLVQLADPVALADLEARQRSGGGAIATAARRVVLGRYGKVTERRLKTLTAARHPVRALRSARSRS